jgi:hypothetical protein
MAAYRAEARSGPGSSLTHLVAVAPRQQNAGQGGSEGSNVLSGESRKSGSGSARSPGSSAVRGGPSKAGTYSPTADTASALSHDTITGSASMRRPGMGSTVRTGGSDRQGAKSDALSSKSSSKRLLVAKPLEEESVTEFLEKLQDLPRHGVRSKSKSRAVPLWIWLAVGGGAIVAAGLMVVCWLIAKSMQ